MKKKFEHQERRGLPGGPNEMFTYVTGAFSTEGYKRNSPDVNNPYNIIPSGNITMEDVDFPVHGVDNLGNEQMMIPGNDYQFPGDMVFETPMYKRGGGLLTKTMKCNSCGWSWKAADGGNDVTTCHKCGGEALPKAQKGDETKPWEPKPSIDPAVYANAAKQFAANERKKQLTGEALKANKNNPQFQAIPQRDKDIETLKGSGINPARLYMKSNDQGSIDQYVEPEFEEQALNYLANPMTTLGYLARGEDLPNFVPDKGNVIDNAMDVINPFAYLDYGDKAYDNLSNDEYAQAAFNFLAAIPSLPKLNKASNAFAKVVNKIPAKVNPNYFTPNSNMYYRGIGREGMQDALESGLFRANQNVKPNITGGFDLAKDFNTTQVGTYYSPNFNVADKYGKGFIAEVPRDAATFRKRYKNSDWSMATKDQIPIDKGRILEKNWWSGYKPVEVPKQLPGSPNAFKSEIDWAKWNPEIPENKALMQEYNAIEQATKADGTWMKNADGSKFNGTPEQFVQQNSENFKKAYPDGASNVYRGTGQNTPNLRNNETIFTANRKLAEVYSNKPQKILGPDDLVGKSRNDERIASTGGLYDLLKKNSDNSINWDGANNDWSRLDLNNKGLDPKNIKKSIELQKKHAINQRKLFDEYKQHSDGSWHHPNGKAMSNELYMYEKEIQNQSSIGRVYELENLLNNPNRYPDNIQAYEKMKKDLGSITTTDDIASYIERSGLDNVTIRNINDSGKGDVSMVNHKSGNYLKSNVGNNGMFDMTNPNIFKALIPLIGVGAVGAVASQSEELPENKYGGSLPKAQFGIEPKDYTTFVDTVGPAKSDGASYVSDAEVKIKNELYEAAKEPVVEEPTLRELYNEQEKKEQEALDNVYTIKRGDNLSAIANKFNTSVEDIVKYNNISNPRLIFPNQIIKFPKKPEPEEKWQPVEEIDKKTKEINNMSNEDIVIKGQYANKPSERYIIVDKKNSRLKVYGGDKMISSMEIVPGANIGDAQTVTKNYLKNKNELIEKQKLAGVKSDGDYGPITKEAFAKNNINFQPVWKTDWNKGNKSTGAGVYKISNTSPTSSSQYANAPSFNMINERGLEVSTAIHGTANKKRLAAFGNDAERKAKFKKLPFDKFWDEWMNTTGFTTEDIKNTTYDEALNDLVVADNRLSNGCINGKCKDLEALYSLNLPVGTPIYILPEDEGNKFQIVDGKPVLRMSKKNREKYEGVYIDEEGNEQKSQGSNYSINTLTYKPIKGMLDDSFPDKYVLDESKQNYRPEYVNATLPFIKGLEEAKQDVMKIAKIPGDVYNKIAKMTFGIYGAESNYGLEENVGMNAIRAVNKLASSEWNKMFPDDPRIVSSPDVVSKYYTYGLDAEDSSVGYTQVKFKWISDEERKALRSIGIFSNEDFLDPVKAAKGTAMILAIRYNPEKKDMWEHLTKTWNRAKNYPGRVKDNSRSFQLGQLDKLETGGEINDLDVYKNYVNGSYNKTEEQTKAKKIYDKLNRVYYKEAKANNTSVPNYIMTNIISKSL